MTTKIEWAEDVWNPVRGCSRVSEGCRFCYAERQAIRHAGPGRPYEGLVRSTPNGPRWTGKVVLVPEKLSEPLSRTKPTRFFVNSMSDAFHEGLELAEIVRVLAVIAAAPRHDFLILTKRADRMREILSRPDLPGMIANELEASVCPDFALWDLDRDSLRIASALRYRELWPLPNLWAGVSIESDDHQRRARQLARTPAAVRWISFEPLLGRVAIRRLLEDMARADRERLALLDWAVIGGESGPGARPCSTVWIREIAEACHQAGVAVFVKQLGAIAVDRPVDPRHERWGLESDDRRLCLLHAKGGDPEEWPEDLRVREFPNPRSRT